MIDVIFFFFFQAEDGIRDYKVTGVQTCALPIYLVTVFVVCAHPTHIGQAAACDSHTNSHCRSEITPRPTPVPGNSVPTLTEPQDRRKALNPTDYSLFRHMRARK